MNPQVNGTVTLTGYSRARNLPRRPAHTLCLAGLFYV